MAVDRAALGKAIFNNDYSNNGVLAAALGKWSLPPDQFGTLPSTTSTTRPRQRSSLTRRRQPNSSRACSTRSSSTGQTSTFWQAINQMLTAVGFKMQLVPIDYNKDYIGSGSGVCFGNYPGRRADDIAGGDPQQCGDDLCDQFRVAWHRHLQESAAG